MQVYAATHSVDVGERNAGWQRAYAVDIGNNVSSAHCSVVTCTVLADSVVGVGSGSSGLDRRGRDHHRAVHDRGKLHDRSWRGGEGHVPGQCVRGTVGCLCVLRPS